MDAHVPSCHVSVCPSAATSLCECACEDIFVSVSPVLHLPYNLRIKGVRQGKLRPTEGEELTGERRREVDRKRKRHSTGMGPREGGKGI